MAIGMMQHLGWLTSTSHPCMLDINDRCLETLKVDAICVSEQIAPGLGAYGFGKGYNESSVLRDKIDICKECIQKYIHPGQRINRKYSSYRLSIWLKARTISGDSLIITSPMELSLRQL